MRILGIDPGLATIGLSVIDAASPTKITVEEWLTIETEAGGSLPERLLDIQSDLIEYLATARPDLAVVERLFFAANAASAFEVAHARGAILVTLAEHGIPVLEPTPLQLKACITGDGKADKEQVRSMLQKMLSLTTLPSPDDAADALALAVYGALMQHAAARYS